jgi:transcriptional regulator with XRE-family HTH domain
VNLTPILRAAGADVSSLRLARVLRGMSQRELERRAGLPATTVSHFEAGRRIADPATRARLALALDVDADVLFGGR